MSEDINTDFWNYVVEHSYQSKEVDTRYVIDLPLAKSFGKYGIYFSKESHKHPATMNVELAEWVINKYTQKNWNICDPMAGIGTVPIVAALNERNCVAFDIEERYVKEIMNNYNNVTTTCLTPVGKVLAWQADTRELKNLSSWPMRFDFLFFSPPYLPDKPGRKKTRYQEDEERGFSQGEGCFRYHYSDNEMNIGNPRSYDEYKQLMQQVYLSCHAILNDYKKMVLITKNGVRNGKVVSLDTDTIKMCQAAGFNLISRYWFKVQQPSFFFIENVRKWYAKFPEMEYHPYSVYEDVLILER